MEDMKITTAVAGTMAVAVAIMESIINVLPGSIRIDLPS